jgi:hypothetical protein
MTRRFVSALLLAAAALLPVATAAAEVLADPTRPPASMTPQGTVETPRRPLLQSIIITPRGRAAIIDDEHVELHARFRDAEVAQITESEVVLRSKTGIETLRMYPGVEKTPRSFRR